MTKVAKKGKCPECGEEIDHLDNNALEMNYYTIALDEEGRLNYELDTTEPGETGEFRCPECGKLIARTEGAAMRVLNGEIETKEEMLAKIKKE
jgi:predicted RNA-binding Zn-ribbon protein involved in translation (DUF1610 family)